MDRITVPFEREWLTVEEVAAYLAVTPFVLTGILRRGEIPAVKVGREWRVARVDLEAWLNDRRSEASP